MNHTQLIGLCVLAASSLAACGGGDDYVAPVAVTANEVVLSPVATSAEFTDFVVVQAAASSETAEPLSVDKLDVPPTSETAEPLTLN